MSNTPYFDYYEKYKNNKVLSKRPQITLKKYFSKTSTNETYLKDIELFFYDEDNKKMKINVESISLV